MQKALFLVIATSLWFSCSGARVKTDDSTLAVVGSRTISVDDFLTQVENIRNTPGVSLISAEGRTKVLKEMMNEELVFQRALEEGFHLKNLDVKHEIVKLYLTQKFGRDFPPVTEEQIQKFYNDYHEVIDQIRASHILIKTPAEMSSADKEKALAKIKKIRADIVSGNISFDSAAQDYSEDVTKDIGGDLGYFDRNRMVAEFSGPAFKLTKIGEMTPVIETPYGYHIIKLTADLRGMERNKEKIRMKLLQDSIQPKVNAFFEELHQNAKMEITAKNMMSIQIPNF